MSREIHPGMGAHITMAWVLAYNLVHLASIFCSHQPWYYSPLETLHSPVRAVDDNVRVKNSSDIDGALTMDGPEKYELSPFASEIPLWNTYNVSGFPRRVAANTLPPPLTEELLRDTVSQDWKLRDDSVRNVSAKCANDSRVVKTSSRPPCVFAWISGLSEQQSDSTWVKDYFQRHTSRESVGISQWTLSNEGRKLGWTPLNGVGDELALTFANISQPIRVVTFFTMKSYGPKWAESRVHVNGDFTDPDGNERANENITYLEGFHAKQTSEVYTKEHFFSRVIPTGGTLQLSFRLQNGTTFKIMGLALC
jgi:hypothetical protein